MVNRQKLQAWRATGYDPDRMQFRRGQMSHALSNRPRIGLICVAAVAVNVTAMGSAAGLIKEDSYNSCGAISDDKARLLCFDKLTSPALNKMPIPGAPPGAENPPDIPPGSISGSQSGISSIPVAGKWRLVRIPDPRAAGRGGKDIVSLMGTAELSQSDIDFAGLSFRCGDPDLEVLIFLIRPLRPQAQPAVAINGKRLYGSVLTPGTVILLPGEASDVARQQWGVVPNLSIEVEDNGARTHGLVSLEGFDTALKALTAACVTR